MEWLRDSLVLLHCAVAEWRPATPDNYPIMPEGILGSQGEVTHWIWQSGQERLVALPAFHSSGGQAGTEGKGGRAKEWGQGSERGWVTGLFFTIWFSIGHCLHSSESSAPSALDAEHNLHQIADKSNF